MNIISINELNCSTTSKTSLVNLLLFVLFFMPTFVFAQDIAFNYPTTFDTQEGIVEEKQESERSSERFLEVDFDNTNSLIKIFTKENLEDASITVLTAKDELICQESKVKINKLYLLAVKKDIPRGVYFIYIEQSDGIIWIERFVKNNIDRSK